MTGAVLQALAAVGRARGAAARRAVTWLRDNQNDDGGFGQFRGRDSNAQSTSYAVQGLVAAGAGGSTRSRALSYLTGLQRADGSIAYSAQSSQTPVWVTAQALMALERRPLPLSAVPRRKRPQAEATAAAPPSAPAVAAPPPADAPSARGEPAANGEQPGWGRRAPAARPGRAPDRRGRRAARPPRPPRPKAASRSTARRAVPRTTAAGCRCGWWSLLVAAAALALFLGRRRLLPLKRRLST